MLSNINMPYTNPVKDNSEKLVKLRRYLHQHAELSDQERVTSEIILDFISAYKPDELISGIGGYGIAAVFDGETAGPRILVRSDMDALPVDENIQAPYSSITKGVSHKCGHDGHMAITAGLAPVLSFKRPKKGSVILFFQPSEETGRGAARVAADPEFLKLAPDMVFGLHNLPGFAKGLVVVRENIFASASKGMIIELKGVSSHAAEPEKGNSPAIAAAHLIQKLSAVPQTCAALHEAVKVTVIHAKIGERAFGTSPGEAAVMATLRTYERGVMERMTAVCESIAEKTGTAYDLSVSIEWTEVFPETQNHTEPNKMILSAARAIDLPVYQPEHPFPWSEDFGHFTRLFPGALFGLGSGENQPALHHPEYDFPDSLIITGTAIFNEILIKCLE